MVIVPFKIDNADIIIVAIGRPLNEILLCPKLITLSIRLGAQGRLRTPVMMRNVVMINCTGASTQCSMCTAKLIIFSILPIFLSLLDMLKYQRDMANEKKGANG